MSSDGIPGVINAAVPSMDNAEADTRGDDGKQTASQSAPETARADADPLLFDAVSAFIQYLELSDKPADDAANIKKEA